MVSAPIRVGSTRCMVRRTVTDVAWSTLAQPTAAAGGAAETDDATAADEAAAPPAPAEDAAEDAAAAQPASAEHSSTASTGPRTWREDIMLLGRTPRAISSIVYPGASERARRYEGAGRDEQREHWPTLPTASPQGNRTRPLQPEQQFLAFQAAAVAGEAAVAADHPVARHDDRDRVGPVGQAHRARRDEPLAQRAGDVAVADRAPVRNRGQLRPHR